MIKPAPTGKIEPTLARGRILERVEATATRPARIVLGVPNSDYRLHLIPEGDVDAEVGARVVGTIHAKARRVDECGTGGRYVEPVYGRPRRVQGWIVATVPESNEIVVNAGVPIHCELTDGRQRAEHFQPGDLVSFDVLDGATFRHEP